MPLLSIWKATPNTVGEFSIEQVVTTAGDGNLRDGSVCSDELRVYFSEVPSEKIGGYAEQCLSNRLEKGGMVLQDLVNELGRRLDFKVTNGRYQGTVNTIGFDGIWVSPEGQTLIVEVKTTDAYRISLDTIVGYRHRLATDGVVTGEPSILVVVGRQDTGELEAQVRGSKHAWDIRLISAESLIKLVRLKENTDDAETGRKIRSVLSPVEYTRLDRLVDVMFTAVTDVAAEAKPDGQGNKHLSNDEDASDRSEGSWDFTDPALLQQKRDQIIRSMAQRLGTALIKKTRALYWTSDHDTRIACTISKNMTRVRATPIGMLTIRNGLSSWPRGKRAF